MASRAGFSGARFARTGAHPAGAHMFQLSVVDHIRLSFATIAGAYESHAAASSRLARWSWYARLGLVALLGSAVVLCLLALNRGRGFQIAATVLTAAAFV